MLFLLKVSDHFSAKTQPLIWKKNGGQKNEGGLQTARYVALFQSRAGLAFAGEFGHDFWRYENIPFHHHCTRHRSLRC